MSSKPSGEQGDNTSISRATECLPRRGGKYQSVK